MILQPARVRFLTRNLEELQGLETALQGLGALAIGVLIGPAPFLGIRLPNAADWGIPWPVRLLTGIAVATGVVAASVKIDEFYERSYGEVKQQKQQAGTDNLSRAWGLSYWVFFGGAIVGWPWLLAPGALGLLALAPLKWRRDGGVVPSHLLALLLLPGLTIALPQHAPAAAYHAFLDIEASLVTLVATLLVARGAFDVVGGILNHMMLVRVLSGRGHDTDD